MYLFGGRRGPFSFVQTAHRRAGSTSRYRSINEFIPHAHWLMSDPTMNTANCICKYCQRTPQRLITQTMTQANVLPARGSGGMYAGKPKVARLRNMPQKPAAATRLHVSVQRPLKPLRPSSGVDRTPMNQDRNHDLRVLHASAHRRRFKRWFRDGEIIAGEHSYFWTPTDEWEFRYHAPAHRSGSGSRDKSKERGASAPGSLQAALNAAAANNERVERETSRAPSQDAAGVEPDMPADELDEVRTRILGDERPGKAHTQVRYQGLWWGPERIWVDDLVRLKVPRQALAPHGAPHIYAPAPPSAHVVEIARARNVPLPPEQMGAIARSVFMRLSALVVVEYERGGKRTKECRAVGELYELADEGYEEPEPALRAQEKVPESGSQQPPQAATSQAGPSQAGPSQANPPNADPPSNATAKPAPGDVLSGPLWNDRFPLPPPPAAYRWRRITHPGFEAVVSLPVLSGRYYPGILQHPLLRDEMERVMSEMDAASPLLELEGLTSAFSCALEPFKFKQVREQQLVAADQVAREVLASYGEEEEEEEEGNAMEVDEVGDVEMGDAGP
uniref:Cryptic loci regulator 2 N-terminal domain-containing protein n=1 Tax=Schizophyllum commune (strain H4-8 / FGSC 9210) TaxID=578458 RepID=D8Q1J0_SCHCM